MDFILSYFGYSKKKQAYLIIYYNETNLDKSKGRILQYSFDIKTIKNSFDFICENPNFNKGEYTLISCESKYIEGLGESMRDSDLDFNKHDFNEIIMYTRSIH